MTRARKATGHQCVPTSIAGLAEGADYVGQLSRCVKCGVYEAPVSVSLLDDSTWMTARGRDPLALKVDAFPTCEGMQGAQGTHAETVETAGGAL